MKIDHFAYEVSDLEASMRFYTQKLGFKVQTDKIIDEKEHEAFAILELEGGRLDLLQALSETNVPKPFQPVTVRPHACPHLALQVDDFDRSLSMLAAEGIPILHGPLEIPGVAKWMYFCDPDRNVIEFCQDLTGA
jgi:catechol 2,3-dioxygenase-like lactoylglutathione lyase family enzyme